MRLQILSLVFLTAVQATDVASEDSFSAVLTRRGSRPRVSGDPKDRPLTLPVFAYEGIYLEVEELPREVRSFVEKGTYPLSCASADLNGDGLQDFVLVRERQKIRSSDPNIEERQRPFLILVRQPGGGVKEVKRNERIIYCTTCGGMMGDPFQGVEVGPKTFTVSHYGGRAWGWSVDYTFNYSRRDNTWQLVRVEESSFHAFEPDKIKRAVYVPPKHYGKIDIADFDPDNWKGQGQKQQVALTTVWSQRV